MTAASRRHRDAFDALFHTVTTTLARFARTLDADEARWFFDLLERSEAGYRAWDDRPEIQDYLARVARVPSRALANLAHSYLHLAWDLPVLLADSFDRHPETDRERIGRVYAATGAPVAELARVSSVQTSVFGGLAIALRVVPGGASMRRTIGNWLLVHRCSAWGAAVHLSRAHDRARAEQRLTEGVTDAARALFGRPDPLHWLRRLPLATELVDPAGDAASAPAHHLDRARSVIRLEPGQVDARGRAPQQGAGPDHLVASGAVPAVRDLGDRTAL